MSARRKYHLIFFLLISINNYYVCIFSIRIFRYLSQKRCILNTVLFIFIQLHIVSFLVLRAFQLNCSFFFSTRIFLLFLSLILLQHQFCSRTVCPQFHSNSILSILGTLFPPFRFLYSSNLSTVSTRLFYFSRSTVAPNTYKIQKNAYLL